MKNFLSEFTTNGSILNEIMKNLNYEDILKNPYILIEYISLEDIEKVINCDENIDRISLSNYRIRAYIFEYININIDKGHTAIIKKELIDYILSKTNAEVLLNEIENEILNLLNFRT